MKTRITLIALCAWLFALCNDGLAQSMAARDWDIRYSTGMPSEPKQGIGAWEFDFPPEWVTIPNRNRKKKPRKVEGSVNYVTTRYSQPLSGAVTMSFAVTGTGSPVFNYGFGPDNPCTTPANVRFYIERGDISFNNEFSRWWSNPISAQLAIGSTTLTAPFDPSLWSSVFGKVGTQAPSQFAAALQNVDFIGMTFGGGCFFGHGVNVLNGTAKFTVSEFKVVR